MRMKVLIAVMALTFFTTVWAETLGDPNVLVNGKIDATDRVTIGATSGGTYNGNWTFNPHDQFPQLLVRSGFTGMWRFSGNTTGGTVLGTIDLMSAGGDFLLRDAGGSVIMSWDENGEVVVNQSAQSDHAFRVEGTGDENLIYTDVVNDRLGVGTNSPTSKLTVDGTATVDVLEITGGADLSEQFAVDSHGAANVEPGSVVCIDAEKPGALALSTKAYDKTVAGIISGANGLRTGMMMGQKNSIADGKHPVALTGRVYCKVDASNGAVQPGDLLTTSSTPGHAMKVTDHSKAQGAIIGKAMTPLAAGEKGMVLILVSLQ